MARYCCSLPACLSACLQDGSRLSLDFSSLLGPLFFSWLLQLLLPMMLNNLVYEKEKRLRTIMKMHGLGDAAYWAIQVCSKWGDITNAVLHFRG